MHQKRAEDFGILKKAVSWVETRHRTRRVDFRFLAEALGRCRMRWGGGRWKSQNRKNVYLSPYVEEPLNSKVIKSFEPEQRSRKCFFVFRDPMFYLFGHSMYVSHIAISWLRYTICTHFKCQTVLFDPLMGSYQVLPIWFRVDLGVMDMKGYSTFPKAQALLEPHHQNV